MRSTDDEGDAVAIESVALAMADKRAVDLGIPGTDNLPPDRYEDA
jgi:hypothetical protein